MKTLFFLIAILITCFSDTQAQSTDSVVVHDPVYAAQFDDSVTNKQQSQVNQNQKVKPKRRLIAALLCVTLGPFGMHRLYLGTKPQVAAAYTLTLGGGFGLVTVIDFFYIAFSPDISRFKNNDQFIMWKKK